MLTRAHLMMFIQQEMGICAKVLALNPNVVVRKWVNNNKNMYIYISIYVFKMKSARPKNKYPHRNPCEKTNNLIPLMAFVFKFYCALAGARDKLISSFIFRSFFLFCAQRHASTNRSGRISNNTNLNCFIFRLNEMPSLVVGSGRRLCVCEWTHEPNRFFLFVQFRRPHRRMLITRRQQHPSAIRVFWYNILIDYEAINCFFYCLRVS